MTGIGRDAYTSLSLAQLRAILTELAEVTPAGGQPAPHVVRDLLQRNGRAHLRFDVAMALVDAVAGPDAVRPVSAMPLKRLEELMNKIG